MYIVRLFLFLLFHVKPLRRNPDAVRPLRLYTDSQWTLRTLWRKGREMEEAFELISTGAWSIVPPLLALALALITKEVYSSLTIGVFVGMVIYQFTLNGIYSNLFLQILLLLRHILYLIQLQIVQKRISYHYQMFLNV